MPSHHYSYHPHHHYHHHQSIPPAVESNNANYRPFSNVDSTPTPGLAPDTFRATRASRRHRSHSGWRRAPWRRRASVPDATRRRRPWEWYPHEITIIMKKNEEVVEVVVVVVDSLWLRWSCSLCFFCSWFPMTSTLTCSSSSQNVRKSQLLRRNE